MTIMPDAHVARQLEELSAKNIVKIVLAEPEPMLSKEGDWVETPLEITGKFKKLDWLGCQEYSDWGVDPKTERLVIELYNKHQDNYRPIGLSVLIREWNVRGYEVVS